MAATIGHRRKLKMMYHFTIQYSVAHCSPSVLAPRLSSTLSTNQPVATSVNWYSSLNVKFVFIWFLINEGGKLICVHKEKKAFVFTLFKLLISDTIISHNNAEEGFSLLA
jgi:hypothetical protein